METSAAAARTMARAMVMPRNRPCRSVLSESSVRLPTGDRQPPDGPDATTARTHDARAVPER
jgi:hypothetical protein